METLASLTDAFKQLEHGDELTLRTDTGRTYNDVIKDPGAAPINHKPLNIVYLIGGAENNKHLAHDHTVQVKEATKRGLETNGETVTELINHTQETRATNNET